MKKYSLLFLILFQAAWLWAHQPDVSTTVLMEQKDGSWLIQVRAALTAFEYEIENHQGANSYQTSDEFKALVLEHLQNSISIQCNAQPTLSLKEGYVQLGHETTVTFKVVGLPEQWKTITITNSSFKDIYHNQSALILLKKGFQQQQFTLDNSNQHTAQLQVLNNSFQLLYPDKKTSLSYLAGIGVFLLLLLALLGYYRQKVLLAA